MDSETTQLVKAGPDEEFEIELTSVLTAGYEWKIKDCPEGLEPLGTQIHEAGITQVPGGPARQTFRFHARNPSQYVLVFALKRPWEDAPVRIHKVFVEIQ